MHPSPLIRRLLAGCLLLLFAFSITPKKFLHNLVANHRDAVAASFSKSERSTDQLSKAGYHCPCDQLVVQTPFVYQPAVIDCNTTPVFAVYQDEHFVSISNASPVVSFLRGPPATKV